jgi:hypothetical protein
MTTIAYRDGIVASDSLYSMSDGRIYQWHKKIWRFPNGIIYGAAGDDDDRALRELFENTSPPNVPDRSDIAECRSNTHAIVVYPDGKAWLIECELQMVQGQPVWMGSASELAHPFMAVGSGGAYAHAAMQMGATAEQAIKEAIKSDCFTGGKVQVYDIRQAEKTKKAKRVKEKELSEDV